MGGFARCAWLLAARAMVANAEITVGSIFSDHMVLQDHATYDQRPFIYGYAVPAETVTIVRRTPDHKNDTFIVLVR